MLDTSRASLQTTWVEDAQLRFNALNEGLVPTTRTLLNRAIKDATLHSRLLNTLSLLEHMGSHKIMATQHGAAINQATLRHLTEECHHAFFMKRQAEKSAGRSMEYTPGDLLAPLSARMYFQRLEAKMVRNLCNESVSDSVYLYMSMVIEFRAVWFYTLYQQSLRAAGHALSLKRLLGEEQNHLTEMADRLEHAGELNDERVESFAHAEHLLYGRFLESLLSETC